MKKVDQKDLPYRKPIGPKTGNGQADQKKRKIIAYSVLGVILAGMIAAGSLIYFKGTGSSSSKGLSKLEQIYELMKSQWYYADTLEDPENDLIEGAILGMTMQPEDLHTNYFSLDEAEQFSKSLAGSNAGVGIVFYEDADGNAVVRDVFVNSTADQAGLKAGDIIVKMNDQTISDLSSDELVSYIQKNEGRPIETEFIRNGETNTVKLIPGVYDSTVSMQLHDNYGLVTLSSFSEMSGKEFADSLGRIREAGLNNLVIDLRDNTGGYLSAAMDIAGSLLPSESPIFVEKDKEGNEKTFKSSKNYTQVPFEHIYVLQNGSTASASEVLIGALKETLGEDVVTTIGQKTYGKGTEQVSIPFEDGTSLKYTIAEWTTPNGVSINKTGFTPDIETPVHAVASTRYQDMADDESIEPDTVAPNAAAVQVYLSYLSYPANRDDTYFSVESSEALKSFQTDHGLDTNGVVDKNTFDRLREEVILKYNQNLTSEDETMQKTIELIDSND